MKTGRDIAFLSNSINRFFCSETIRINLSINTFKMPGVGRCPSAPRIIALTPGIGGDPTCITNATFIDIKTGIVEHS